MLLNTRQNSCAFFLSRKRTERLGGRALTVIGQRTMSISGQELEGEAAARCWTSLLFFTFTLNNLVVSLKWPSSHHFFLENS